jgi:hypothetical protein
MGEGGLEVTTGASAVPSSAMELGTTTFVVRRTGALDAEAEDLPRVLVRDLEVMEISKASGLSTGEGDVG